MNPFIGKTYAQALSQLARQHGARNALVFEDQRYSFDELKRQADQASAKLLSLGLQPGDRVALWLPNRPEFAFIWLGASQIGLITVVVNTRLRREEFVYQIAQSRARVVITAGSGAFRDFSGELAEACSELCDLRRGEELHGSQVFPELRRVVSVDAPEADRPWVVGWRNLDTAAATGLSYENNPDKPAMIAYSSGTTALPKGALLSHCIWRKAYDGGTYLDLGPDDRLYLSVPLFGVLGFLNGLLTSWAHGAGVVLAARFDATHCLEAVQRERCTLIHLLPAMIDGLLAHSDFSRERFASVRGGVVLSSNPDIMRRAVEKLGIPGVVTGYGLTESTGLVARCRWDDPLERRLSCQGRPLPGCELRVVDAATGKDQPPGEPGEIWVGGYSPMLGYFEKPEDTRCVLPGDGWLRSGDFGCLLEDGSIRFLRRLGDGYKHKGFNVSIPEVEAVLLAYPGVELAAVVHIPDPTHGEIGVAYVTSVPGRPLDGAAIHGFLRQRLASFKLPERVFVVDSLPTTSGTQKVQKFKLRDDAIQRMAMLRVPSAGRS